MVIRQFQLYKCKYNVHVTSMRVKLHSINILAQHGFSDWLAHANFQDNLPSKHRQTKAQNPCRLNDKGNTPTLGLPRMGQVRWVYKMGPGGIMSCPKFVPLITYLYLISTTYFNDLAERWEKEKKMSYVHTCQSLLLYNNEHLNNSSLTYCVSIKGRQSHQSK